MAAFEGADLQTPRNVTLWFAPGARLVIRGEAVVRIDGPLRAESTWIFACEGQDVLADPRRGIAAARRGRVILNSSTVTEVYPEWWGAIPSPDDAFNSLPPDDTEALEDCIRSAHTLRVGTGGPLPTIPIALRGRYFLRRELEVSGAGPKLANGSFDNTRALTPNYAGIVLLGRQQGGSQARGSSILQAGTNFTPSGLASGVTTESKARALLRLDGLHASIIEGVTFSGGEPGDSIASVCVQITGNNARSTVFRSCSFVNARHVLAQVGDYVIPEGTVGVDGWGRFPRIKPGLNPGLDLSGLVFEDCRFESGIAIPDEVRAGDVLADGTVVDDGYVSRNRTLRNSRISTAHEVSGVIFQAGNTLPMTLDSCFFVGGMRACVEAYGGTLIVRGGGAQNQATATLYELNLPTMAGFRFERPRGGVDFFLGDPLLRADNEAASPTGLTILQFESQSDQLLDTFRHIAAGAGRTAFYPSVLQGASHRSTQKYLRAPPSMVWAGPGIPKLGAINPASLTLVGCLVAGPRPSPSIDDAASGITMEPSGVVVVDARVFLVNDVGTRTTFPSAAGTFFVGGFSARGTFGPVPEGIGRPTWFRNM
jgi:hypothetical protein